jgi:hypothetical protein
LIIARKSGTSHDTDRLMLPYPDLVSLGEPDTERLPDPVLATRLSISQVPIGERPCDPLGSTAPRRSECAHLPESVLASADVWPRWDLNNGRLLWLGSPSGDWH